MVSLLPPRRPPAPHLLVTRPLLPSLPTNSRAVTRQPHMRLRDTTSFHTPSPPSTPAKPSPRPRPLSLSLR